MARPAAASLRSSWPPPGVWIVASRALQREIGDDQPYPHVDGSIVRGPTREVKLWRRDCWRCGADEQAQREAAS